MAELHIRVGTVEELHRIDPFLDGPPETVQVWWCRPTDAAVALGSRQPPDLLDQLACRRADVGIVRRRSGGGAVLIRPEAIEWIDLVVPAGGAPDDVRSSMRWAGRLWDVALSEVAGGVRTVHHGGMVTTAWSELVCFSGIGPGELVSGGRKLVGLSQRRTRAGIRVQGMVHRAPLSSELAGLFAVPLPDEEVAEPACLPDLDGSALAAALARHC